MCISLAIVLKNGSNLHSTEYASDVSEKMQLENNEKNLCTLSDLLLQYLVVHNVSVSLDKPDEGPTD